MVFISSDGGQYLAVTIGNVLKLVEKSSGAMVLHHMNQLDEEQSKKEEGSCDFICHSFSKDGTYFAALTENKKVLVWTMVEKSMNCSFSLPKRPTCLDFCHNENALIAGDKYGDVYKCVYEASHNEEPTLLLGHLSMVLSVKMSPSDQYIITADRDEKIRISCYPNAYTIHSYCLGHAKLVSSLFLLSDNVLLSGSADSTLKCWNFLDGIETSSLNCAQSLNKDQFIVSQVAHQNGDVFVIGESCKHILYFTISNNCLVFKSSISLLSQPYSICFIDDGELLTLLQDTSRPFFILQKSGTIYSEKESKYENCIFNITKDHLPEPLYYTQLIKPLRGKRTNAAITPEATINIECASKIVKPNQEGTIEE